MQLTAIEKAKELIETFGKELAPKVVDEILESHYQPLLGVKSSIYKYWEAVKKEINNLKQQK